MPSPLYNPDLMVLGDSVAQGCRSSTVNQIFCAQSYPAIVASLLGVNLDVADHVRPVLIDLEAIAENFLFDGPWYFLTGANDNYAKWKAGFAGTISNSASGASYFDNLAVTSATLADVVGAPGSSGTSTMADGLIAGVQSLDLLTSAGQGALLEIHKPVNSRFVLNPSNDTVNGYQNLSQVGWVTLRQPKRLIVHAGHNDGLYAIGSLGSLDQWNAQWPAALSTYRGMLANLLPALPNTQIVVAGLPRVSAVANLMAAEGATPSAAFPGYFTSYQTVWPGLVTVTDQFMAEADDAVQAANATIASDVAALAAANGNRISFFSMYDFFSRYDTKNPGAAGSSPVIGGYTISNTYIRGRLVPGGGPPQAPRPPSWKFLSGGLQGIDGMHPTAVGYALLALEIASIFKGAPIDAATRNQVLSKAVSNENLISPFPQGWECPGGLLSVMNMLNQGSASSSNSSALAQSLQNLNASFCS